MLQHRVNTIPRVTEEYLIKKALSKGCYSIFVTAMKMPKNNPGQEDDNHCLSQNCWQSLMCQEYWDVFFFLLKTYLCGF